MKKGLVASTAVILIILVFVLLMSLGVAYIMFIAPGGVSEKTMDSFCSISTSGKHLAGGAFPELCKTRPKVIESYNWDECPHYGALRKKINDEDFEVVKNYWYEQCMAEQLVNLMTKCWQMMGKGGANRESIECYSACISKKGLTEKISISEDDIFTAMSNNMEGSDKSYSDILSRKNIQEVQFWDNVLAGDTLLKSFEREKIGQHINDGDVISILFIDVPLGRDVIALRYKTEC